MSVQAFAGIALSMELQGNKIVDHREAGYAGTGSSPVTISAKLFPLAPRFNKLAIGSLQGTGFVALTPR